MTAIVLATTCAMVYGAADFFGGLATKRSRVHAVVVVSQLAGLAFVLALMPLLPGEPEPAALLWGMLAGLAGGGGLLLFYRALATGTMSVVAPITATVSAGLPVLFGLAMGERPGGLALAGIGMAIIAVLLVSTAPSQGPADRRFGALAASVISGAGFGAFFILIGNAPEGTGLWPLLGARIASIATVAALALLSGRDLRPGRGALRAILVAGVLDMAANVLYLFAVQRGMLSLVAVIVSLYPASTLLLARHVLGERLNPLQIAGVGFALGAVTLIAAA